MMLQDIKTLSLDALKEWFIAKGVAPYRANQVFKWIYLRQADSFEEMTDLGKPLRQILADHFCLTRLDAVGIETSRDGSRKYLFRLKDANHIESVLIPEKDHYTLCISSQAGCAMGCRFCLTGKLGFVRNLTVAEIVSQVRDVMRTIPADGARRLTNIVFMGMGEPLANYSNVVDAISIMTDADCGLKLSTRKITLSTCGLVPELGRLGMDTDVNLAISLNASDNKTRDRLMPINRKYPLEALIDVCRRYPLRPRKRITFEYILIGKVNDSDMDARRLAKLLRPIRAKINLIPLNEADGIEFKRPDEASILAFQTVLKQSGYTAVVRYSKGADISGACGQLHAKRNV